MTYAEFEAKSFSEKSVFDRPQFDLLTNLIKWVALRVAYVLFKLHISANFLDVLGLFFSLGGFILISTALEGEKILPLVGIVILYLHVLLDFIDGPIAKANGTCTAMGGLLDEIGSHVDRFAVLILLGLFSKSTHQILINVFVGGVVELLVVQAKNELPQTGITGLCRKLYVNKYSFLSMRFTLVLIPFLLMLGILDVWNLKMLSQTLSIFYAVAATVWFLICIPMYGVRKNSERA